MRWRILITALLLFFVVAAFALRSTMTTAQAPLETDRVYVGYQLPTRLGDVIYTGPYHNYLLSPIRWVDSNHFRLYISDIAAGDIYPAFIGGHEVVLCTREYENGEALFQVVDYHNDCLSP